MTNWSQFGSAALPFLGGMVSGHPSAEDLMSRIPVPSANVGGGESLGLGSLGGWGSLLLPLLVGGLGLGTKSYGTLSLLGNTIGSKIGGAANLGYNGANLLGTLGGGLGALANRKSPMNAITYLMGDQLGAAQRAGDWEQIPRTLPGAEELNPVTQEGLSQYFKDAGFTVRDGEYNNQLLTPELFTQIGKSPEARFLVSSPKLGAGKYYVYNENNVPVLKAAQADTANAIDMEAAQLEKHLSWMERAKLKKITDRFRWIGGA